ncbi:MAG: hypothetical protein N2Z23_08980 [Pyrinomonadaceae bacterium]|nr:hypothetical protein [Pyrinomonadaceae bacterium]MCX7640555.1 hypothetical protein [Pyrinomonadaceae bacterium]MDW8303864.1 hypothetical protein [Acidobacteriota bacterium]
MKRILIIALILGLLTSCSREPMQGIPKGASENLKSDADECNNEYFPTKLGSKWDYKVTQEEQDSQPEFFMTKTISKTDEKGFLATIDFKQKELKDAKLETSFKCEDSSIIPLEPFKAGIIPANLQSEGTRLADYKTISTKGFWLPKTLETGKKWSYEVEYSVENQPNTPLKGQGELTQNYEVLGRETITVSAGTFNAVKIAQNGILKIKLQSAQKGGITIPPFSIKFEGTAWYAPNVGLVKQISSAKQMPLLPSKDNTEWKHTMELISYEIP